MMKRTMVLTAVTVLLMLTGVVSAAERADAEVTCEETATKLVFDCTIMLSGRKSKQPLEGAGIIISADMPSMPMAHNVPPVEAEPMGHPGMYRARMPLEMYGEWALKMTISGPTRDVVVHKLHFGGAGHEAKGMGHGHMRHGETKAKHQGERKN